MVSVYISWLTHILAWGATFSNKFYNDKAVFLASWRTETTAWKPYGVLQITS